MKNKLVLTVLVSGAFALGSYAQSTVSAADKSFMNKAAEGGLAEVQLGQLAEQKGAAQPVKDFGHRMVMDHGQANDKLKGIASTKGVTLPASLSPKDKALYDKLSAMSGEAFDKAYMQAMIKDHNMDVAEFRKETKAAKDPDVKSFATSTLPTLEDHLRMAKEAGSKVGAAKLRRAQKGSVAEKR
jgi:putative membrane protein